MTGIEQAVEKAGGQAALGAALKPPVSQQAISKMVAKGYAPVGRAREIAKLYDLPIDTLVDPQNIIVKED